MGHSLPATQRRGMIELVLAMVLAGSSVVVGKLLSTTVPVYLAAELSLLAALVAILPLQLRRPGALRRLTRRDLGYMALQALFGIVAFRVLTLTGLRLTSASHAGVVTAAAPAVTALLAALLLRERLPRRALGGILLTVAGLAAVSLARARGAGTGGNVGGDLLVLGAVVCEALLTIFRRKAGATADAVTNTTVLVAIAAVALLPAAIGDLTAHPLREIPVRGWLAVIYYGSVATVAAYILWGAGALRVPAHRAGLAMAFLPVSSVLLSVVILREPIGVAELAGCAVVATGVVVGAVVKECPSK